MSMSIEELFSVANKFNSELYGKVGSDFQNLLLKDLVISLHSEVSDLASAIKLSALPKKPIENSSVSTARDKILFESVDVMRYLVALLNIAGIESDEFANALAAKEVYLNKKYLDNQQQSSQKPVIIVDIDDVLNNFRTDFHDFVLREYGVELCDKAYYSTAQMKNPDLVFMNFIEQGGFKKLSPKSEVIEFVNSLSSSGNYEVVLLTSRPGANLRCVYETYWWLDEHNVDYCGLNFAGEKYLWISQQDFSDRVVVCIDDSLKHISEYTTHGLKVLAPKTSYNSHYSHEALHFYESDKELKNLFENVVVV